jgi:hypothetical protein
MRATTVMTKYWVIAATAVLAAITFLLLAMSLQHSIRSADPGNGNGNAYGVGNGEAYGIANGNGGGGGNSSSATPDTALGFHDGDT